MRSSLLAFGIAALLAGCSFSPKPSNGAQKCGTGTPRCPDGYFCADTRCYQNGYKLDASPGVDGAPADARGDSPQERGVGDAGTTSDMLGGEDAALDLPGEETQSDAPMGDGPSDDGPLGPAPEVGADSRLDGAGGPETGRDTRADLPVDRAPGFDIAVDERSGPEAAPDLPPDLPPLVCTGSTKKCGETCVSITDPLFGCAGAGCNACPVPANATATCTATGCGFACTTGSNLCGTACVVESVDSCGTGCTKCTVPANSRATCTGGACGSQCLTDFRDCNNSATDGCEINITTSPTNCGACGHDCLGGDCVAGKCQPVTMAIGQLDPADMAVDATNVYWTATGDGKVLSMPRLGTSATAPTVVADTQASPKGILLDGGYVYWSNYSNVGSIHRRAIPVAASSPHMTVIASGYYPYRMAIAGTRLYWTEDSTAGSIRTADLSGVSSGPATPTELLTSQSSPKGIAIDTANLYWTIYGEVRQATLSALTVSKIAASEQFPFDLRADADTLYWSDGYASTIRKAAKGTAGAAATIATLAYGQRPLQIALDATSVYWANPEGGSIQSVSKQGGSIQLWHQSTLDKPQGIAVDAQNIYWTESSGSKVWRLAK